MTKIITVPSKRLSESITSTASSFKLNNIKGFDKNDLTSSDMPNPCYVSFQDSSGKELEFMEIDPTTIASSVITILKRGLSFSEDGTFTEVSANKKAWIQSTTIVNLGTNPPQLYAQYLQKDSQDPQTINSDIVFNKDVTYKGTTNNPKNPITREVLDSVILTNSGIALASKSSKAGEFLVADKVIRWSTTDGLWYMASDNDSGLTSETVFGFISSDVNQGDVIPEIILLGKTTLSGQTIGNAYLGNNGAISTSGNFKIGVVEEDGVLRMSNYTVEQNLLDASKGNHGLPSNTNRYVTEESNSFKEITFSESPVLINDFDYSKIVLDNKTNSTSIVKFNGASSNILSGENKTILKKDTDSVSLEINPLDTFLSKDTLSLTEATTSSQFDGVHITEDIRYLFFVYNGGFVAQYKFNTVGDKYSGVTKIANSSNLYHTGLAGKMSIDTVKVAGDGYHLFIVNNYRMLYKTFISDDDIANISNVSFSNTLVGDLNPTISNFNFFNIYISNDGNYLYAMARNVFTQNGENIHLVRHKFNIPFDITTLTNVNVTQSDDFNYQIVTNAPVTRSLISKNAKVFLYFDNLGNVGQFELDGSLRVDNAVPISPTTIPFTSQEGVEGVGDIHCFSEDVNEIAGYVRVNNKVNIKLKSRIPDNSVYCNQNKLKKI